MDRDEAAAYCLRLLNWRPRSKAELARRLREKGCSEEIGGAVIEDLCERGWVNDYAFALIFARDQLAMRPQGRRRLKSALGRRGVDPLTADRAITHAMLEWWEMNGPESNSPVGSESNSPVGPDLISLFSAVSPRGEQAAVLDGHDTSAIEDHLASAALARRVGSAGSSPAFSKPGKPGTPEAEARWRERRRLSAFLERRGFSRAAIRRAFRRYGQQPFPGDGI